MNSKANVLIVEDDGTISLGLEKTLKRDGYKVISVESGEKALSILSQEAIDLVLLDIKLPKMNGFQVLDRIKEIEPEPTVIMITALHDVPEVVKAIRSGAYDYIPKPFENETVRQRVRKALENKQLKKEVMALKRQQKERYPANMLFGNSPQIKEVKRLIELVASTPRTPILIQGESGTGKELVADAIHNSSARATKPMIKINCSAIPELLLESELFGHEKGAFTDAKTLKKGMFELANNGSIFLDEISSMKMSLQPKILRVLEDHTIRRIGGIQDIKIDVRIIAASNRDIDKQVQEETFREDLLYRLKVMVIEIPPLRERKIDILPLAKIFIEANNKEFNKNIQSIAPEAENLLQNYNWPGNVRELKNVMERAAILADGDCLKPEHLPLELKPGKSKSGAFPAPVAEPVSAPAESHLDQSLQEIEKKHIIDILNRHDGNKSKAARILNISRSTLREKLKVYGIS
ncbi:sigma-54-dependent Fis family transcriptional regulator [candidate division KSB1 bacterium]|nr:sigma-54-dependent Fis family transcriptional regulator [candidate division KSB1 bacterium]